MLPWKLVVIGLMLVLMKTVHGDFGLNITVPNLTMSVADGVGQGTIPLVKANETIESGNIQDDNGVIVALIDTISKVLSPLNKFLGSTLVAASDRKTNSEVIFNNLNDLASQTRQSLDEAVASASGLENKIKPMLYSQVVGNVTELAGNVDSVKTSFGTIYATVDQVKNSRELVTPENISSIITPDMVNSLISPLKGVAGNLNNIASLITTVLNDQLSAMYYRNLFSSSFGTQQRNYERIYVGNIVRAIGDVNNTIVGLSTGFETSVKQAYSPIMNQQQQSRQQSFSNLTIYLDSMENSTKDFIRSTNQSFTTFRQNINQTLTDQSQIVLTMLYDAVRNLTILSSSSESPYADRCLQIYGSQLSLSPVSVGRLSQCSQGESSSSSALVQTVRILLDQAKSAAMSSASGVRVCQKNTGPCSDLFFSAFSDLAQQTSAQFTNAATVVQREVQVIEKRIRLCALATTADIDDNVRSTVNKYDSCLLTGV